MPLQTNQSSLPNFTTTSLKNANQELIKLLENPIIIPDEEADNINNNHGSSWFAQKKIDTEEMIKNMPHVWGSNHYFAVITSRNTSQHSNVPYLQSIDIITFKCYEDQVASVKRYIEVVYPGAVILTSDNDTLMSYRLFFNFQRHHNKAFVTGQRLLSSNQTPDLVRLIQNNMQSHERCLNETNDVVHKILYNIRTRSSDNIASEMPRITREIIQNTNNSMLVKYQANLELLLLDYYTVIQLSKA